MPASERERKHINELIEAHTEHLKVLQLQSAKLGASSPAHIFTEIDRCERELAQLRQSAAISISGELAEELGVIGRYQLMSSHVMRLDSDIGRLEAKMDKIEQLLMNVLLELVENKLIKPDRRTKVNNRKGGVNE